MTRIFDALRKAQSSAAPAPAPDPGPSLGPTHAVPPRPTRPVPLRGEGRIAPRPVVLPPGVSAELPEDLVREMTTLRVSLESSLPERAPRIIMMTSSQGGEGTSTVLMQFALALAQDTRIRTLVVDLHARRPAHPALLPASGSEGTAVSHLDVLPFAELYGSAGVIPAAEARAALESFGPAYDWLLLDGPPVLESSDSATLAAIADGVVMVIQAHRTKRPVLARGVELLRKAGSRVLGSVLNRRRLEIPEFIYRRI